MGTSMGDAARAKLAAIHRTIPTSRREVDVNLSASLDLSAVVATDGPDTASSRDLRGVFIYLSASGADVTIQRGNAPATAGAGFVLTAGAPPEEFYLDPSTSGASLTLYAIAGSAAAKLHVMWDDDQAAPS